MFLILAYCNTIFKRPSETRFNRLDQNVLVDTYYFNRCTLARAREAFVFPIIRQIPHPKY
ncbi:hypothetical protein NEISUBOT_04198 [Neisseria subflava NJ9703]|uniref:Uncharacterized protein n=1 Tax=Neisseria subflava NJ9703 TaxID=546268 RepID=A0A9W5IRJ5_NEISU|nr:hypothetical protein NEISUBOT_04198 [Neisseria subflava NJ9703]